MPNVDQFESVFKAATKPAYRHRRLALKKVAVITDEDQAGAERLAQRIRAFLAVLGDALEWIAVSGDDNSTVEQLLGLVDREKPDLLVTYRNVHSAAWQWPHSLGRHLDVLTQATQHPVLVIPHPRDREAFEAAMNHTRVVMAVTDHLAGDSRLVDYAVTFTEPGGKLLLTHIEDDATYDRYIETISKIPSIDTDNAREQIMRQLLKEPHDYTRSCAQALKAAGFTFETEEVVKAGHHLSEYRNLIAEHSVELLVINTKDEEQLAMHGMAYSLAIELRQIPILML